MWGLNKKKDRERETTRQREMTERGKEEQKGGREKIVLKPEDLPPSPISDPWKRSHSYALAAWFTKSSP